jgi:hypothetical protein
MCVGTTTVKELDGMHRKHLLPGFDDRDAEEVAIQLLTSEITQVRVCTLIARVCGDGELFDASRVRACVRADVPCVFCCVCS